MEEPNIFNMLGYEAQAGECSSERDKIMDKLTVSEPTIAALIHFTSNEGYMKARCEILESIIADKENRINELGYEIEELDFDNARLQMESDMADEEVHHANARADKAEAKLAKLEKPKKGPRGKVSRVI